MISSMFVIDRTSRLQYAALFILKEISDDSYTFHTRLEDDEKVLEPIIEWLIERTYIFPNDNGEYAITKKGVSFLNCFWDRYNKFLAEYDIFCGVDLDSGDFAFSYFDRYSDMDDWYEFLDQERWEDLRIAVAEYKGMDALEIVFMSFINDGRFGRDEEGWDEELLLGSIWDEIQAICNSAVRLNNLAYEKNGVHISAEQAMQDVIEQGMSLAIHMQKPSLPDPSPGRT